MPIQLYLFVYIFWLKYLLFIDEARDSRSLLGGKQGDHHQHHGDHHPEHHGDHHPEHHGDHQHHHNQIHEESHDHLEHAHGVHEEAHEDHEHDQVDQDLVDEAKVGKLFSQLGKNIDIYIYLHFK